MANAINANGTHERQERYADAIVKLMRPSLKIRSTFSRDYEGSPVAGAVKVPVRNTDVKVSDYDVKSGVTLSQSATSYLNVPVDNHKAINELIDGYEADAVPDNLVAQRLESGAYSISKTLETDAIEKLVEGTESEQEDCTAENVYSNIVKDIAKLAKKGIDKERMYVAIDYAIETLLLTDQKYSNTTSQIGAELAREGVVNKINGVKVIVQDLGEKAEYIIYGIDWCQAIDEWKVQPSVNNLNDGSHIGASALQGRMVYTDVITNKEAVIVKKKTSIVDPEITSVTVSPEAELTDPVSVGTKVATVSVSGGTGPYTYTAGGGTNDEKFTIESEEIKAKEQLNQGTYKLKVKVTDSKSKEKISDEVTITVNQASEAV